jgi:thiol-disulfide isomerase/thioredoxin
MKSLTLIALSLALLVSAAVLYLFVPLYMLPSFGNVGSSFKENMTIDTGDAGTKEGEQSDASSVLPAQIQHAQPAAQKYVEFVNPSGFLNSQPFTMKDVVGKKVILVEILTYSCINCQRTFPHTNALYAKYKDQGLEIIGIHTPEFAYEKDKGNVQDALQKFGIQFPVVQDNAYETWNAYGNQYWPHTYLVDIHGSIVYDHVGEGGYEEIEKKVQALLQERSDRLKGIQVESVVPVLRGSSTTKACGAGGCQ